MDIRKFLDFMTIAENLKNNTRHSWTSTGRHESVAEHSWRLSLMAYFIKDEFLDVDINKIILMCLFHDIGEAITGDIPVFLKTKSDETVEDDAVFKLLEGLPQPYNLELFDLFTEMNEQQTLEARIYKALDKIEVIIQHNEADISTWLPLEYELNLTHGTKEVEFSSYLKELKQAINEETKKKINSESIKTEL